MLTFGSTEGEGNIDSLVEKKRGPSSVSYTRLAFDPYWFSGAGNRIIKPHGQDGAPVSGNPLVREAPSCLL